MPFSELQWVTTDTDNIYRRWWLCRLQDQAKYLKWWCPKEEAKTRNWFHRLEGKSSGIFLLVSWKRWNFGRRISPAIPMIPLSCHLLYLGLSVCLSLSPAQYTESCKKYWICNTLMFASGKVSLAFLLCFIHPICCPQS